MINYSYTCRADSVQGTRQVGARQTCTAATVRTINSQEVIPDDVCSSSRGLHEKGRPRPPLRSLSVGSHRSKRRGTTLPRTTRTHLPQEGPSIMSPNKGRCTSKAMVSPDQGQPDTAIATLSSCRPVIHSSTGSIRGVRRAHHRPQPTEIICNREEQNYRLTERVKGISGNSGSGDTASSWQYRGRQRYGPVR
jgi:hypothetical protein